LVWLLGGTIIYWFAAHGEYFDQASSSEMPTPNKLPPPSPAEREAEEYAVYHVILQLGCINSHTFVGEAINTADYPELDPQLIEDYNIHQDSIPYKLELDHRPGQVYTISETEMDEIFSGTDVYEDWNRFHERYPCSGIEGISRVGFNLQMDEALVYYGYQKGPTFGEGKVILLVKGDDGAWKEEKSYSIWVS
jgi:hypothetical protein